MMKKLICRFLLLNCFVAIPALADVKWNCKPASSPNEGSFELNYKGKSPVETLFAITDSKVTGDGLDGLSLTSNPMGDTPLEYNDETEVRSDQQPYDALKWGNDLPTNRGGIQYALILPSKIGSASSFTAILWKTGPVSTKVKYKCSKD